MNLFQFFSTLTITISSARILILFRKGRLKVMELIFWLSIWMAGLFVILFPVVSVRLAGIFGIKRGTDVIIYSSVVLIFVILYKLWAKLKEIEEKLGKLASHLTIKENNGAKESENGR